MGCGVSKSQAQVVAETTAVGKVSETTAVGKVSAQNSPRKPPKTVKEVENVDDDSPVKNKGGMPVKNKAPNRAASVENSKDVLRELQSEAKASSRISELDGLDEKWDEELKPSKPASLRATNSPLKAVSPKKNSAANGHDHVVSMPSKASARDKNNDSGWTARVAPSDAQPSKADEVSNFDRQDSPGRDAEPMEEVSAFHSPPTPPQPTASSLPPIMPKPGVPKKPGPGHRNYDEFDDDDEDEEDDLLNQAERLLNEDKDKESGSMHDGPQLLSLLKMSPRSNGLKPRTSVGNTASKGKPPPPPKKDAPPPPPPVLSAEDALWKSIQDSYHRDEEEEDQWKPSVRAKGKKDRKAPARKVEKITQKTRSGGGDADDDEDTAIEEVYQPRQSRGSERMHQFYSHGSAAVPGSDLEMAISPASNPRGGKGGKAGAEETKGAGKGTGWPKPPPVQRDGSDEEMSDEDSGRGGVPKFRMARPNLANDASLFGGEDELDDGDVINLQGASPRLPNGAAPPHPKRAAAGWGVDKLDSMPRMDIDGGFEDEDEDYDDDSDSGPPYKGRGVPAFR